MDAMTVVNAEEIIGESGREVAGQPLIVKLEDGYHCFDWALQQELTGKGGFSGATTTGGRGHDMKSRRALHHLQEVVVIVRAAVLGILVKEAPIPREGHSGGAASPEGAGRGAARPPGQGGVGQTIAFLDDDNIALC